jgi:hypothetical protein
MMECVPAAGGPRGGPPEGWPSRLEAEFSP